MYPVCDVLRSMLRFDAFCDVLRNFTIQGTMEEKIYDRQVTKQSLSFRVVDEQQINRYFTAHDLQELYNFHPLPIPKEGDPEPIHALPKVLLYLKSLFTLEYLSFNLSRDRDPTNHNWLQDKLLAELLVGERTKKLIASYHTHNSLLDHQETEELTEEERKAAWEEYEKEKMVWFVLYFDWVETNYNKIWIKMLLNICILVVFSRVPQSI